MIEFVNTKQHLSLTIIATWTAPTLREDLSVLNQQDLSYEIDINNQIFPVAASPATIQTAFFCPCTARIRAIAGVAGEWSATVQVQ